jgi:hypothetical protein
LLFGGFAETVAPPGQWLLNTRKSCIGRAKGGLIEGTSEMESQDETQVWGEHLSTTNPQFWNPCAGRSSEY